MSRNQGNQSRSSLITATSILSAAAAAVVTIAVVEHGHAQENNRESIIQGVGRWIRESVFDSPQRTRSTRRAMPSRPLTPSEVSVLPVRYYSTQNDGYEHAREPQTVELDGDHKPFCVVCREPYGTGERLMRMPCFHEFHVECIGDYLRSTADPLCPICRHPVSSS